MKGLKEALDTLPEVCTNYDAKYVDKTFKAIKNFRSGNAVFTFPKPPIKCPGAPQKIAYIAEKQLTKVTPAHKVNVKNCSNMSTFFRMESVTKPRSCTIPHCL